MQHQTQLSLSRNHCYSISLQQKLTEPKSSQRCGSLLQQVEPSPKTVAVFYVVKHECIWILSVTLYLMLTICPLCSLSCWCATGKKGRGFIGEVIVNTNRLHAMAHQQPGIFSTPASPLKTSIEEHRLSDDFEFVCKVLDVCWLYVGFLCWCIARALARCFHAFTCIET